ncbi:MAG TPA: ribosome silencing factor [Rhizobium sp.]|nr:ribosome silencing factor [Rhizobium sp.]
MTKRTSESVSRERQLLALVCKGLDDKKAGDLKVIDVRGLSSITDYIVIATGLAEPHLRAMRIEVEKVLDAAGAKIGGMDKNQQSGWLVVDAYQIMVHLFTAEARSRYGLEQLWRDGKELTLKAALGEEKIPAEPKVAKAATAERKPIGKKTAVKKLPTTGQKRSVAKSAVPKRATKKSR